MADFIVTTTNDSGAGSLRQALADAEALAGADRILFDAGLDGATITLTSGALAITNGRVSIQGDIDQDGVEDVTISGGGVSNILTVGAAARVELRGLVLTDGFATGASPGGGVGGYAGGAIVNAGELTILRSTISDSVAVGGDGGDGAAGAAGFIGGGAGGAILNAGVLNVKNSSFVGNSATGGEGGEGGNGTPTLLAGVGGTGGGAASGIFNLAGSSLIISNAGFYDSSATGGDGGDGGNGSAAGVGRRGGNGGSGGNYAPIVSYGAVSGGGIAVAGGTLSTGTPGAGGTGPGGNGYSGSGGLFGSTLLAFGTAGADVHIAFEANQNFFALGGHDSVEGGAAFDYIDGGSGNDTLSGGNVDQIYGSDGNDLIFAEDFAAGGLFDGQGGIDTLDLSRAVATSATYDLSGPGFTINGASFAGFENVTGTASNERIIGGRVSNILSGGAGDDTLDGGGGADRLTGGLGLDLLRGGPGSDIYINPVTGGPDGDTIIEAANGGAADRVLSDASFTLAAATNVEQLTLTGLAAIDGTGNALGNLITGNDAANVLDGGDGNDTLNGGLDADLLKGGNGADELIGSIGADTLQGGTGNDTINGGKGNDRLNGGADADVFRFATSNSGVDRIAAFSAADDRFDLSGGAFTEIEEVGANTRLTHDGGLIVVENVTGLSLAEWNALVLNGGGAAGSGGTAIAAADFPHMPLFLPYGDFL